MFVTKMKYLSQLWNIKSPKNNIDGATMTDADTGPLGSFEQGKSLVTYF